MTEKSIRPIQVNGNLAYIPLTRGYKAVIDANDLPLVEGRNWTAFEVKRKNGEVKNVYAIDAVTRTLLHRHLLNAQKGIQVDHADGDGLNNKRTNIRIATHAQNMRNRRIGTSNTSGVKGVYWHSSLKKWCAQIEVDGKRKHLGVFMWIEDAAAAYAKASAEMHGDFGNPDSKRHL